MLVPYDLWEAIILLPKVPPKPTGEVRRRLDPLLTQRKLRGLRTVMHPALPDKGGPKQSIAVPGVLAKVGPRLHLTFPRLSLRSTRTTWQGATHGDHCPSRFGDRPLAVPGQVDARRAAR